MHLGVLRALIKMHPGAFGQFFDLPIYINFLWCIGAFEQNPEHKQNATCALWACGRFLRDRNCTNVSLL